MQRIAVVLPGAARLARVAGGLGVLALAVAAQGGEAQRTSAPPPARAPLARAIDSVQRLGFEIGGSSRADRGSGPLGTGGGPDCNANGVPDDRDIASGASEDCDGNGVPDECQPDCDGDGIPDACEADCDRDGVVDDCDGPDCNANGAPDSCDIFGGVSRDCNANGIPDECEPDCDGDGIPDVCEGPDCNGNGLPDNCDLASGWNHDANGNGILDDCEEPDCNGNGVPDGQDIFEGTSGDCNGNTVPDECEADCDGNGLPDDCETDCNGNGIPDPCDPPDCNSNGRPDGCDVLEGLSQDCNGNAIPDECEPDCDDDGIPDACDGPDCNANGFSDSCDLAGGTSTDCDANGVPDECQPDCDRDGIPDACEADADGNGSPDACEDCPAPLWPCGTGCYALGDRHGSSSRPSHGLRLDYKGTPVRFSFELPGTSGTLCYDHSTRTVTIHGRAFGGVRGSGHPSLRGYADVAFVYTSVTCTGAKLIASDQATGFGTLVWLATGDVLHLFGRAHGSGELARLHDARWTGVLSFGDDEADSPGKQEWDLALRPLAGCPPLPDCDGDGISDGDEVDCDADGIPDGCESDTNADGTVDDCE